MYFLSPSPQEEMERLKAAGASEEDQQALLKQHQHQVNSLVGKLEADRLRMQTGLQDRLRQRRQDKLQQRQEALRQDAGQQHRQLENYQQKELHRLKMDEVGCVGASPVTAVSRLCVCVYRVHTFLEGQ